MEGVEKYNVSKSSIIDKIAVTIQQNVSSRTSLVILLFPKKHCNDFDSCQKQCVCFVLNHAGFGETQFLE